MAGYKLRTGWQKEIYLNISFQSYISTLCLVSPYLGNLLENIPPMLCLKRQLPVWGKDLRSSPIPPHTDFETILLFSAHASLEALIASDTSKF